MGKKRVSVRTTKDGIRARHYPPDETHPDGRLVMLRDTSPLREMLKSGRHAAHIQLMQLRDRHRQRIVFKKAKLTQDGIPSDKHSL